MFIPVGDNIDRKTLPVLPAVLVFLNLAVFVHQGRIAYDDAADYRHTIDFMESWGLVPSDLASGRFIGLFTHMFLHGGLSHVLGNLIVLWAFACSLEAGLGKASLSLLYLSWGLAAGGLHAIMNWGSDIPLVGASGAIAGLIGAYMVLYGADSKIKTLLFLGFKPIVFQIPAIIYCGGWFYLQIWEATHSAGGNGGGVAWYAHIGGFVAGAVTALVIRNNTETELVRDRGGELTIKKKTGVPEKPRIIVEGDEYEYAEHDVAGDGSSLPDECPYCTAEITDQQRITPGVARCGNEACGRFIYAGAVMV